MKRYALQVYRCPLSGQPLHLEAFKEHSFDLDAEDRARLDQCGLSPDEAKCVVEEGVLWSDAGYWYPIVNYIPILLDFPTPLHDAFREKHERQRPGAFKGRIAPAGAPRPGEAWVQRSFTKEWRLLGLDAISFGYSSDDRDAFIELELDWPPGLLTRAPRVLEVGCGSGFETASLARVTAGAVFGFDLNLALLEKGADLAQLPFASNAVASLFSLPLAPKSFDLVYSNGVLHHTHSTREAFDSIIPYARPGGVVYVWLYSDEDYGRRIWDRVNWSVEEIVRPRLARLPNRVQDAIVGTLARRHFRIYRAHGMLGQQDWTLADSEHSVRDRWTPPYAHRHSFKEVISWFRRLGMEYRLIDPTAYEDRLGIPLIGVGIRGVMPTPGRVEGQT